MAPLFLFIFNMFLQPITTICPDYRSVFGSLFLNFLDLPLQSNTIANLKQECKFETESQITTKIFEASMKTL